MMSKREPIRFGGQQIDGKFCFEMSGGALALNFVNTLDERPRGGLEQLTSYDRLLDWAHQSGVADEDKVKRIRMLAALKPTEAQQMLGQAVLLREATFGAIARSISKQPPTSSHLQKLNRWAGVGAGSRRLVSDASGGLAWQYHVDLERLDFMLPAIVDSLVETLANPVGHPVKLCASAECDWAFVDRTRRHNRLWCDMTVCGNRAKARRHHLRTRIQRSSSDVVAEGTR